MRNYFDFFKHPIKTINVKFDGYVLDQDKDCLPKYNGIYLVYRCFHNQLDEVDLKELVYIGKAEGDDGIKGRLSNHKTCTDYIEKLTDSSTICYAYANVEPGNIDMVENALIYKQQPVLNDKLKDSYNHDTCRFVISGECALLKKSDFVCYAE